MAGGVWIVDPEPADLSQQDGVGGRGVGGRGQFERADGGGERCEAANLLLEFRRGEGGQPRVRKVGELRTGSGSGGDRLGLHAGLAVWSRGRDGVWLQSYVVDVWQRRQRHDTAPVRGGAGSIVCSVDVRGVGACVACERGDAAHVPSHAR